MLRKRLFLASGTMLVVLALVLTGCGPKPISQESVLDTPDYHVSRGINLLDRGDLDGAMAAFERAQALDPDYAEAYSGMALVEAERGNFDQAMRHADEGIDKGRNRNAWTFIARGRVYTMEADGDDWLDDANDDFEKAVDIDPNLTEAYFWWGIAKKRAYDFRGAEDMFQRVLEFNDEWSARADREYETIQKILRAAPGTRVGMQIALIPEIDRADLAVLFIEELRLPEIIERIRPEEFDTGFQAPTDYNVPEEQRNADQMMSGPVANDIQNHWAKSWIEQIIDLGIMEVSPDNRWYPDELITRAEYALFVQNILIHVVRDEGLATRYIGENSRFRDMRSNTATYNAAALCVDRGIMDANIDGTFKPMDNVSGPDALLIIRDLQNELRMEF